MKLFKYLVAACPFDLNIPITYLSGFTIAETFGDALDNVASSYPNTQNYKYALRDLEETKAYECSNQT